MEGESDAEILGPDAYALKTMSSMPLIAVTTGSRDNFPHEPHLYIEALQKAGAMAEFIHPGSRKRDLMDHFDGFVIPGGKDIDPLLYNEEQRYAISRETQKRTDFELFLLREATKKGRPVLGICYGMQVINTFFKGSLYQDIQSQKTGSRDHRNGMHPISIEENPFLKGGQYEVNSSHHQALKEPGRGLMPFACSDDGIIEGIYLIDYGFLLGVQWHPERMDNALTRTLFSSFVEVCHEHK